MAYTPPGLAQADPCVDPFCHPASTQPPGGLAHDDTPQFILVTFDDGVNTFSESFVQPVVDGLRNPDGLMAPVTYFITEVGTDLSIARKRYAEGNELANHTSEHTTDAQSSLEEWLRQMRDLNFLLVNSVGVRSADIRGFRAPNLLTNQAMWQAVAEMGFRYESSVPEGLTSPPVVSSGTDSLVWPHTLDHGSGLACLANTCPDDPIPGLWSIPMWNWYDSLGNDYGAMDPAVVSDSVFREILYYGFAQRYNGNRCPLGIYLHAGQMWNPARQQILRTFLQETLARPDVWMITPSILIAWMQNPVPVSSMGTWLRQECPRGDCIQSSQQPEPVLLRSPGDGETIPGTSISVSWDVMLGSDRYHLQLSEDSSFSTRTVDTTNLQQTVVTVVGAPGVTYYWRVRALNEAGPGDWSTVRRLRTATVAALPRDQRRGPEYVRLAQAYPNPFNGTTTLRFLLSEAMPVRLTIHSLLGQELEVLLDEMSLPGEHRVHWDAEAVGSGVYFARLIAGNQNLTQQLLLLK